MFESAGIITIEGSRIIEPGKITEFHYTIMKPSPETLERVEAKPNLSGQMEKEGEIHTYQFAFSSGHIYSNELVTGSYMTSDDSTGKFTAGLNINLLKGALPVLKGIVYN